jgi:hypothetical protein
MEWEVFLPSGNFQICFAKSKDSGVPDAQGPVHSFPIASGSHDLTIKWNSKGDENNAGAESPSKFQHVKFWQDGVLLGVVNDLLPVERVQSNFENPVPTQVDLSPTVDAKLPLVQFRQTTIDGLSNKDSPTWKVWIEQTR